MSCLKNYPFKNPSEGSCQSWHWFQVLEDEARELHQGVAPVGTTGCDLRNHKPSEHFDSGLGNL